jgi:hypothetical protein
MTNREKELEQALAGFERTGDTEIDSLVDSADGLARHFAAPTPAHPRARALFIEAVAARKRSFMSSLAVPAMAAAALLVFIAVMGRSALPGESLYPVRNVLRSAGLATAPTSELQKELDEAEFYLARAEAAFDRGSDDAERFAVAALKSLGRAEAYLDDVGDADRVRLEGTISVLSTKAITLIRLEATTPDLDHNSGNGSDDSESQDNSGSGSDDSGSDDNSGSGSDNSGSGSDDSGSDDSGSDDNSGSGSSGSDDSGGDSSGPGSGSDD